MTRALMYDGYGSIDVLHLAEIDDPKLSEGELRVDVVAAGLNPLEFKFRQGKIKFGEQIFPRGTGQDFAGIVTEVYPGARYYDGTAIAVGDEVLGWTDQRAVRESLVALAGQTVPKPAGLSWAAAASLQTSGLTADACIDYLAIGSGDTVLVSAAAGGVGQIYSQMALQRGATVIGSASAENADFLRSIGVLPVTYGPESLDAVRKLAPSGLTAVQDNVGKPTIDLALELGVPKERICSIGDHGYAVSVGIGSPGMFTKLPDRLADLARRVALGELVLSAPTEFALEQFADAYGLLESRHSRGKIVILLNRR
jgi:NADPH:quinone reductase-like Zn-dependent oxidoreductase